jgi:NodT family efflux transporter outer membrane factor (OMF) lipoprotein
MISRLIWPLLLVLSGCTTLGPDFKKPELDWVEQWHPVVNQQLADKQHVAEVTLSTWWHLFNDPVLNGLIDEAVAENLSLRVAGLRILESRAYLGIADSSQYPVIQANGTLAYVNSQRHGGAIDRSDQSTTALQSSVDLGWELDFWGRFKRGIESADAAFMASLANQHDAQVLLTAQIVDLYYGYRTTQMRIKIAKQNVRIQQRSFEISQKRYESGQESELDLHQAKTQYLATLSSIPGLEISLAKTANALSVLLGRGPGDLDSLLGAVTSLPQVDSQLIKQLPAELLLRRPDVRAALWKVAAQSAQIGLAQADLYPSISLFGSIGWSQNSIGATADVATQSFGPAFRWNIFDSGRIKNNILVQDARLQQAITVYQSEALQAAREVDDAAISIVKTAEQRQILVEAVASAERALVLANNRYKEGYANFQRVLDAQRAKFTQEDREVANQGAHINAVVSLYKSLGGGWINQPLEQMVSQGVIDEMQQRVDWNGKLAQPLPVVQNADISQ